MSAPEKFIRNQKYLKSVAVEARCPQSITRISNPMKKTIRDISEIKQVIVHCSYTPPGMDIGAAEIREWHTLPEPKGRGWRDIGYHVVIRRDGTIETGRPFFEIGAHCKGQNLDSIGVVLVGGMSEDKTPVFNFTEAQMVALSTYLGYLSSVIPGLEIHGHNWYSQKECPCFDVEQYFGTQEK